MQDLSVIRSPQDICFQELPHRSKARMYNVHSHYAQLRFISVTLHCLWATFGWSLMAIVSADPSLYTRVGFHCMPPQSQARGIQSYMIARIIIIKQPAWRRALREVNRCCAAQFVHTSWPNSRQKAKLYPANNQTCKQPNLQTTKQPNLQTTKTKTCKQPNNQTANNQLKTPHSLLLSSRIWKNAPNAFSFLHCH